MSRSLLTSSCSRLCVATPYLNRPSIVSIGRFAPSTSVPVSVSRNFQTTSLAAPYNVSIRPFESSYSVPVSAFQKPKINNLTLARSSITQKRRLSSLTHHFPMLVSPFCGLSLLRSSKNKQLITTQKLMLSMNSTDNQEKPSEINNERPGVRHANYMVQHIKGTVQYIKELPGVRQANYMMQYVKDFLSTVFNVRALSFWDGVWYLFLVLFYFGLAIFYWILKEILKD